jgi:hypothetical protein
VLKSRLVTPQWTGDGTTEGADPELDDRCRGPNVFHYGSRELTSQETRHELQAFIAQRRERATNIRRRPDGRGMLTALDSDGLPYLGGEDDLPDDGGVAIREDVVAEIVIETGRYMAGLMAEAERVEE